MREIYLDNSATTAVLPEVAEIVQRTMLTDYGNPSALHTKGVEAEKYIREARAAIAGTMRVRENEIFFTSGGSESNNWAITGYATRGRRGSRLITTAMEHPAVSEVMKALEKEGFEVVRIGTDSCGRLDMEALTEALTEDVCLVSTMYVNNEIGAVTPVAEIGKLVHERCPNAAFHVDAIQAYGKYRIFPRQMGIDMLSVSGHKIHGPKGTGFLYVRSGLLIKPLIYGGGQQNGMRSGTENVPGVAGLGVAAKAAYTDFDAKIEHLYSLRERLISGLSAMEGVVIHGMPGREGAPHIVNAAFPGVGSEVLQHTLEDRGIYISAGSACSSHKRSASPTLTAIAAPREELTSSVRFSFCEFNTAEEVDETLKALSEVLPMLRRYRRH